MGDVGGVFLLFGARDGPSQALTEFPFGCDPQVGFEIDGSEMSLHAGADRVERLARLLDCETLDDGLAAAL